jgi:hypothetical protein
MDPNTRKYATGSLRASDADRDQALAELSEHFQAGRLTAEEFDERSSQALAAKTGNDLGALLTDLPASGTVSRVAGPAPVAPRPQRHPWPAIVAAIVAVSVAAAVIAAVATHGKVTFVPWWIIPIAIFVVRKRARGNRPLGQFPHEPITRYPDRSTTRFPDERQ